MEVFSSVFKRLRVKPAMTLLNSVIAGLTNNPLYKIFTFHFILSLIFVLNNNAWGQKNVFDNVDPNFFDKRISNSSFNKTFSGIDLSEIQKWVQQNYGSEKISFRIKNSNQSRSGNHYLFDQYFKEVRIYEGTIKVNTDKRGFTISIFNNLFLVNENEIINQSLGQIPKNIFSDNFLKEEEILQREQILFFDGTKFKYAYYLKILKNNEKFYEVIIDKHGNELNYKNLVSYYKALQDTNAKGFCFNPDPLTSAKKNYNSISLISLDTVYRDWNDSNIAELNNERLEVNFPATFGDSIFTLENDFVKISDFSNPSVAPATNKTGVFNFGRGESGFEDVNVLYHLTSYKKHLEDIGYPGLVNYQISADPHALNGADNSMFNPGFNPPRLFFGTGGVDDAEDADVIIHEYGHAIMYSAAPNTLSGTERQSLDEANGDFFAGSYSQNINPFNSGFVFSWDGHNEYWAGRNLVSSMHYPEDIGTNYYAFAEIWSSTLMQLIPENGREITEILLLESIYSYAPNMTMNDAALLYLKADSMLNNFKNRMFIEKYFSDRGLLDKDPRRFKIDNETWSLNIPLDDIKITNTDEFSNGKGGLKIKFPYFMDAEIKIFDISGRIVYDGIIISLDEATIQPSGLETGIYILKIKTGNKLKTAKLIRY